MLMLPSFTENLSELRSLVAQIHGMVLCISPQVAMSQLLPPHLPWVIYMCVCATDGFSLGVFLLQSRVCIPLHDHPGMHTTLRELHNTMHISCMDQLGAGGEQGTGALQENF
jgi:cysteamine dioxygenase